MTYELFIAGMNGDAWVRLLRSLVIQELQFSVVDEDGTERKVNAPAVLRSDGAIQPVVAIDGKLKLQTPEGLSDGVQVIPGPRLAIFTKELPDGSLQFVRRTGHVGVAPKEFRWEPTAEPEVGQWRIHPSELLQKTSVTRGKRIKKAAVEITAGTLVEFEKRGS